MENDESEVMQGIMLELIIAQMGGDRTWEGKCYFHLGSVYYKQCNFRKASQYYTQALSIAEEVEDKDLLGKTLVNVGITYDRLGNFKQAIEYYEQSLSIAKELGDRASECAAYGNLGIAYQRLGNFKQAIEYHEQNLSITKEIGDRTGEGKTYGNLGIAYRQLGNFKQAIEYQEQHLRIAEEIGDRIGEGNAYGNLGAAYRDMGNLKQSIECFKQCLSVAKERGDRAVEGTAYGNLGNAYHGLGNFKRAIEYHEQHLSIAKETGDRAGEGIAYANLGGVYRSLGNFKQAIEYHEQHLSIAKEIGDRAGEGAAYGNLGIDYNSLSNCKQAIECHEQCLSIAKEIGDRAGEGKAYGNLGNAYRNLGNFKQAIEYHTHCLNIAKEIGDRDGEGNANGNLGDDYHGLGDFKQAVEYHNKCRSIAKEIGDKAVEGNACCSLGLDYELLGSLCEAVDYYQTSVEILDKTRDLLQSEDAWKIDFRHLFRLAYTGLWRTLLKTGDADGALCAAEQGRAQALRDILQRSYGIEELTSFNPKETISSISNCLSIQTVFMALDEKTITFWVLRKGAEIHVRQKEIQTESATVFMETVLKEIGAGVDIRCEDRSLAEINDDVPTGEAVEKKVYSSTASVNPLCPLYDVIIDPIADLIQGDELIIVPDGPFCLAPYPALSESIRIHTVPSLTAFKMITGSLHDFHSKRGALLVGDPCMEEVPMKLSQLPCAKKEVEMIGGLLKTTPLSGRNATKGEVLKRISSVALVHIAAHGCAQTGEIALAPNPDRASQIPKEEDFILTMSDVKAVRLRARLVVLSCCHSGRGEVKSEGVVGIARAFLCAGARSVLVSLWAIDDEATLLFMRSFYKILADGESTSVALHQAMKSLRESQTFCAVKHWAPFVLIGDDVTVEFGEQH